MSSVGSSVYKNANRRSILRWTRKNDVGFFDSVFGNETRTNSYTAVTLASRFPSDERGLRVFP